MTEMGMYPEHHGEEPGILYEHMPGSSVDPVQGSGYDARPEGVPEHDEPAWKRYADIAGAFAMAGINKLGDELQDVKERISKRGLGGD